VASEKEHNSLLQSRNFGTHFETAGLSTENRGNSASMRMSMMNTNTNKFVIPTTSGGQSGHLRNNKSISIGNGPIEQHSSMIPSHRKKSSNQHSRNNSQKITTAEKEFFS
jgi:hypothetical protein